MGHRIRFEIFGAVIGIILSVAATANAGWFNFFGGGGDGDGDDDQPQSLILGEKGAKLESLPVPPPILGQPAAKPMPYPSDSATLMDPPPPSSGSSMAKSPLVDPDGYDSAPIIAPPYGANACCAPVWTIRAGALFLHRSRAAADPLFNYGAGATPIGANVLGLGTRTGYDLGLTRRLTDSYDIDFRFFGVSGWSGAAAYPAGTVSSTALGNTFGPVTSPVALSYGSNLYSNEVNLRRWFTDSWAITGGARFIDSSEGFVAGLPGTGTLATINTTNHLYGGQMGLVWRKDYERWWVQANGNAGIYDNFATAYASSPLNANSDRFTSSHLAFVSDLAFVSGYRLTKHVAIRSGYQLLWIDSMALAPGQANTINLPAKTGAVDFGHTFYHGATFGFDITW